MGLFEAVTKVLSQRAIVAHRALLCLGLLLVLAQSVSLAHSHDHDLNTHFDCEMCLHMGSHGALVDTSVLADVDYVHVQFSSPVQAHFGRSTSAPNSRAPPQLS
ncbi:MAG: hypothetical protein R3332_12305 [Pseudohongiellaceae bacterium]|nr:hypothetical protein [Pseudohongiellaceae bacterium]